MVTGRQAIGLDFGAKERNVFTLVDSRDSVSGSEEGDRIGMTNEAELLQ